MIIFSQKLATIKDNIKIIPDYPKSGVIFYDITNLMTDPKIYSLVISLLVKHYREKGGITKVVGIEARGFLIGAPVALGLKVGFVPVRKPNKLPCETYREEYKMEYGFNILELHKNSINSNDNVLIVDDLLATGGTIEATVKLIHHAGGKVKDAAFVINLTYLNGNKHLTKLGIDCFNLVNFCNE